MLKIRAAGPDDLEILQNLAAQARTESGVPVYMDAQVLAALLAQKLPGTVLLAFSEDVPVGYCSFSIYGSVQNGRVELYLDDLYVLLSLIHI